MQRSLPKIIITTYTGAHKNMGVNQDEHNNYNGWSVKNFRGSQRTQ